MYKYEADLMKDKISSILYAAKAAGRKNLVLGALGCGAYRCPPTHVAQIFAEAIQEVESEIRLEHIVFAVLNDHNAYFGDNFQQFKKVFIWPLEQRRAKYRRGTC